MAVFYDWTKWMRERVGASRRVPLPCVQSGHAKGFQRMQEKGTRFFLVSGTVPHVNDAREKMRHKHSHIDRCVSVDESDFFRPVVSSKDSASHVDGIPTMSRKQFCVGLSAVAMQPLCGKSKDATSAESEWTFPFADGKDEIGKEPMSAYGRDEYHNDILTLGFEKTWEKICRYVLRHGEQSDGLLAIKNFGELYEDGLAFKDKSDKKENGQYYTPEDVAAVMSGWFDKIKGDAVCDVACGVGNLILSYLELVGDRRAKKLLRDGKVHLYDLDETALRVCVTSLAVRYGTDKIRGIHVHQGDFLSRDVVLPAHCKVISNPPYAAFRKCSDRWELTETIYKTKELYSSFMEKIIRRSDASVIITPYSFIGGTKFYPLRRLMNEHGGFVVSFDNVPGAIFNGRKHGVFNSNTGNSVRAAITVVEDDGEARGFRFSPLIRFKNSERKRLLSCATLEGFVGSRRQTVSPRNTMFAKCDRRLERIYDAWLAKSDSVVGMHVGGVGKYTLSMPNTCRYFTVASDHALKRIGQITLWFSDEDVYWLTFCMVNSSFAYWHWRLFDGGITYPYGLLVKLPIFPKALSADDKKFCREISKEMIARAGEFVIRKNNVGVQENVKYPREFRDRINRRFLDVLGLRDDEKIFDVVHSNMALEVNT